MAATWTITNTEYTNDSDKGVVHAAWQASDSEVIGSGDDVVTHTGTVSGMESFYPDPSSADYIAYESLDEDTIIGWVQTELGEDKVDNIASTVAAKIVESKTPSSAWGIPWAVEEEAA